ncbi:MAG: acetyl ornithine aminotransferase family protein [Chloroflexi bacterium]|nr:acetyl ornithine aminotransferase family protein [Chloroflexota bacterium]
MSIARFGYPFRAQSACSQEIVARDLNALSSSYTRSYGFAMHSGLGAEVQDVDGHSYIDFAAGIAVLATGHRHPKITQVIKDQADRFVHVGGTDFFYAEQVELAERLQQIAPINRAEAPTDKRVFLSNSGTEAIEAALKLARYSTGRPYIIGFYGGFHGRTMGSLSVTASKAVQRAHYPFLPGGVEHIPFPGRFDCENGTAMLCDPLGYLKKYVFKKKIRPQEVAAILLEPIQGEGGYVLPKDDFLPALRELCDEHGILLIVDEVQSGMGRTGKWLAVEHWGVAPDVVCMAKGLGSGMPVGATIAHRDVMQRWVAGAHGNTFGGNALACRVAAATIDVIREEGLLDHVAQLGEHALERLTAMQAQHPSIRRVEGKGLMIGVEFADADGKLAGGLRNQIVDECFLNGLITLGCGESTLRVAPPLVITRAQLDKGLEILEATITQLETQFGAPQAWAYEEIKPQNVLVIEDDTDWLGQIRAALDAMQTVFSVTATATYDDARLMLQAGRVYDLIVVNVNVGRSNDLSGIDLLPLIDQHRDQHGTAAIALAGTLTVADMRAIVRAAQLDDLIIKDAVDASAQLVTALRAPFGEQAAEAALI